MFCLYPFVEVATLTIYAPISKSRKDKQLICQSVIDNVRREFNASVSEIEKERAPKTLRIGIAVISHSAEEAQQTIEDIVHYIDYNITTKIRGAEISGVKIQPYW
jgi:uncharacterized protein YlxP (DUF503 family)